MLLIKIDEFLGNFVPKGVITLRNKSGQLARSELDRMLDEVRRSRGVGWRDLATRHLW